MKRFSFRLAPVTRYRKHHLDKLSHEVAQARHAVQTCETELQRHQQAQYRIAESATGAQTVNTAAVIGALASLRDERVQAGKWSQSLNEATHALEQSKASLLEAYKRVEILRSLERSKKRKYEIERQKYLEREAEYASNSRMNQSTRP